MQTKVLSGRRPGLALFAILAAFSFAAIGPLANPAPAQAGTAETMEASLLQWINAARSQRGVAPLQLGPNLVTYAGDRAATMASSGQLKHPDCLACKLRSRGIQFNRCAETIAYTSYPWGNQAAQSLFNAWKSSGPHWTILMSASYTKVGIGVAYRSANHTSWASAVLIG